jgi:2'-5' RNA ligase
LLYPVGLSMIETAEAKNNGLGISLPGPAGDAINTWRRLYDPSYELLWPHITLAYPPFAQPHEWPLVRPRVVACLADFQPFKVMLRETGIFLGNPNVLWLKPEDGGIIIRIRRALEEALPEYIPPLPFEYRPHMSIGFFEDLEALYQANQKVQNEIVPVSFLASHVSYAYQLLDGSMQIHDQVLVGGGISRLDQKAEIDQERDR